MAHSPSQPGRWRQACATVPVGSWRGPEPYAPVWDGQPARGYGGTADVVAYAKRTGVPYSVIWPEGATRD
jgi:hypothetical protein